jgi:hypothetical protein
MQETKSGSMAWPFVIVLGMAIPAIVAMAMMGWESVFALARTLITSISIAIVVVSIGFVVRMYRKQDITGEREHTITNGTTTVREIHHGLPPMRSTLQLSDGKTYDPSSFPEYFRAAYMAGAAPRDEQRMYARRSRGDDLPPEAFEGGDDIVVEQPEWIGEFTQ